MKHTYYTRGTCSTQIDIEHDGERVQTVVFHRGCAGNLKGVAKLVEGLTFTEVREKLEGIKCGFKETSCPDQLAKAIEEIESEI